MGRGQHLPGLNADRPQSEDTEAMVGWGPLSFKCDQRAPLGTQKVNWRASSVLLTEYPSCVGIFGSKLRAAQGWL